MICELPKFVYVPEHTYLLALIKEALRPSCCGE